MSAHELEFHVALGRRIVRPDFFEFGEVFVERGGVQDQQTRGLVAGVANRVHVARGYEHEGAASPDQHLVTDVDVDDAIEHEVCLLVIEVSMWRRGSPARRAGCAP